jgi:hypothetical protein
MDPDENATHVPCTCELCGEAPGLIWHGPFGEVCAGCNIALNAATVVLAANGCQVAGNNDPRVPERERLPRPA